MRRLRLTAVLAASAMLAASFAQVACDDSSSNAVKEAPAPPPGTPTAPGTPPPPATPPPGSQPPPPDGGDCYPNPTTHYEIINACTDASKITKNPTLPLILPDGALPPPK